MIECGKTKYKIKQNHHFDSGQDNLIQGKKSHDQAQKSETHWRQHTLESHKDSKLNAEDLVQTCTGLVFATSVFVSSYELCSVDSGPCSLAVLHLL